MLWFSMNSDKIIYFKRAKNKKDLVSIIKEDIAVFVAALFEFTVSYPFKEIK